MPWCGRDRQGTYPVRRQGRGRPNYGVPGPQQRKKRGRRRTHNKAGRPGSESGSCLRLLVRLRRRLVSSGSGGPDRASHPDRHLPACYQARGQIPAAVLRGIVAAKCGNDVKHEEESQSGQAAIETGTAAARTSEERSAPIDASFVKPDIRREIRYITQLAQAEDSPIVTVGNLVLFSTRTRDAWLLDPRTTLPSACVGKANLSRFGSSTPPTPSPSSGQQASRLKEQRSSSGSGREASP